VWGIMGLCRGSVYSAMSRSFWTLREERPVGTNSAAIFIRLSDIAGANRDKPAIANLEFTMECNKAWGRNLRG
jgi:hypothetical protein